MPNDDVLLDRGLVGTLETIVLQFARAQRLRYRSGDDTQVIKETSMARFAGLTFIGNRAWAAESDSSSILAGLTRHFIRFNNLDDLTDRTVVSITPLGANDSCAAHVYHPGVHKFYAITAGTSGQSDARLLEIDPETMVYVERPLQNTPLSSTSVPQVAAMACDESYLYVLEHRTGGTAATRIQRYDVNNWSAAVVEVTIANALKASAAQIGPNNKLYVQGDYSPSYTSDMAHAWFARLDLTKFVSDPTNVVEQLVRFPGNYAPIDRFVITGEYAFLAHINPRNHALWRVELADLTKMFVVNDGINLGLQCLSYDGTYVWAGHVASTSTRFIEGRIARIHPDTLEVVRYDLPDVPASFGDTDVTPQQLTSDVYCDGQRLFVQLNNISGATSVGTGSAPFGAYLMRTVMGKPLGTHYVGSGAGHQVLAVGNKSLGSHRNLNFTEDRGIDTIAGLRLRGIPTPGAPALDTVNVPGGTTTHTYYIVAVDAFGRRSLPSPAGTVTNAAATFGPTGAATAYVAIAWQPVLGAVTYDILKGDTATKLGSTSLCRFIDDGQATSAYTAPTRNETADMIGEGDIELVTAGQSVVLTSPNGTRYGVTVSDAGALVVAAA